MGSIREYFHRHAWQRRVVRLLVVMILGSLVGLLLYPAYRWYERRQADHRLIEQLGSPDPREQEIAVQTAVLRARLRPELVRRLNAALETQDDECFLAVQYVLRRLGKFYVPGRDPLYIDRRRCLELQRALAGALKTTQPASASAPAPNAQAPQRERLVFRMVLCGRDNAFLRRALKLAVDDPSPRVRAAAAPLAARLGDDQALRVLLRDSDPTVTATAALDVGIARRVQVVSHVRKLLQDTLAAKAPKDPKALADRREQIASFAYAMARNQRKGFSKVVCELARTTDDPLLRERLLESVMVLNNRRSRQTVMDLIHAARWKGRWPSGMELSAAARLRIPEAIPVALEVLRAAADKNRKLQEYHVIGALEVMETFAAYPCRKEIYDVCQALWCPDRPALLVRAARLLGAQAALEAQQAPDAPSPAECRKLLRQAVQYSLADNGEPRTTPLSSASAAVALWRLSPAEREFEGMTGDSLPTDPAALLKLAQTRTSLYYLREAASAESPLAGDFVAWGVGLSGLKEADTVAKAFFPPPGVQPREYSDAVRVAGAMILALSAHTDEQRRSAVDRITDQLQREEFPAQASLKCVLLMAGEKSYLREVRDLLEIEEFPLVRALRALLVYGDKRTADRLLWDIDWKTPFALENLPLLLNGLGLDSALAEAAPDLPRPNPAASDETHVWQARIMRHTYGVYRKTLRLGLPR
jgi:hypothetical protein